MGCLCHLQRTKSVVVHQVSFVRFFFIGFVVVVVWGFVCLLICKVT